MTQKLQSYHPLVIEGMGAYDLRKPAPVAALIVTQLQERWLDDPPSKPVLLITQGDPLEERGISAVTRLVADRLEVYRAMTFLDFNIADYHASNADRYKVIIEIPYSELANTLQTNMPGALRTIEDSVDRCLEEKNRKRINQGRPLLQNYYRDFALLQEVTKVACKQICGALTIAHTSSEISEFSVSSFYRVGLASGFIDANEIVPYND